MSVEYVNLSAVASATPGEKPVLPPAKYPFVYPAIDVTGITIIFVVPEEK